MMLNRDKNIQNICLSQFFALSLHQNHNKNAKNGKEKGNSEEEGVLS